MNLLEQIISGLFGAVTTLGVTYLTKRMDRHDITPAPDPTHREDL